MNRFKFLHTADLHIESPYQGISRLNCALGKAMIKYGQEAYDRLIQTALDQEVDFVLLAGDSFDSEAGSLRAQYRFIHGLEKLNQANIPVYLIAGNHDPLESWPKHFKLPENVTIFSSDQVEKSIFYKNEQPIAAIYGVSFGKKEEYRRMASLFKRDDTAGFSIGLLHGTLAGNSEHTPYCPFEMAELKASSIDYWALGHIHKREIVHPSHPLVVYPGNIQGRHFNESGEKGCSILEVENGTVVDHHFVQLSNVIYDYADLSVEGIESTVELIQQIELLKKEYLSTNNSYLLRLRLTGQTSLHGLFSNQDEVNALIDEMNDTIRFEESFVFIDKFINATQPIIDMEALQKESEFIAYIFQQFEELNKHPEEARAMLNTLLDQIAATKVGRALNKLEIKEKLLLQYKDVLENAKWKIIEGMEQARSKN